jgi:ribosomal protein S26
MEDVMRKAVRRLRVRNVIQGLSLLDDVELASILDEFFSIQDPNLPPRRA